MCPCAAVSARSIPSTPFTDEAIRAPASQFVRKIADFAPPSQANEAAFYAVMAEVADASRRLLEGMSAPAPARSRGEWAAPARRQRASK
ncbi:MAG: DUF2277 family protein [Bryobacterales bacterium]|nr:DUF2277 family protein [Bryobacterales bacterium]